MILCLQTLKSEGVTSETNNILCFKLFAVRCGWHDSQFLFNINRNLSSTPLRLQLQLQYPVIELSFQTQPKTCHFSGFRIMKVCYQFALQFTKTRQIALRCGLLRGFWDVKQKQTKMDAQGQILALSFASFYKRLVLLGLIILKRETQTMSRQFDFQNLDLYSCQDFDNISGVRSEPLKTLVGTAADPTDAPATHRQEEFFYQKSSQMPTECFQISFEKDFMKEHQAVFERQLKNYMESFRIYSKMNQFFPLSTLLQTKVQNQRLTCIQFIKTHDFGISYESTQSFVNKLSTFDKLSEFLNLVVKSCPEKVTIQLIHIAKQLLEKYQEIQLELPSQADLLNASEDISRCPKFVELVNLKEVSLNKCKEAAQLMESSKKFMEVYCATTMLVIAQYFENPYNQEEMGCFKRQLSPWCSEDDEQEADLCSTPAKKRKYSF